MKIKNISKDFISYNFFNKDVKKVLNNISFELLSSDILAIIGPNGAGKTTLFKIILDLIEPSSGDVDLKNRKDKYLAYVNTNSRSFFWRLSARDNLIFHGKLLDLSKDEIISSINSLSRKFEVENILDIPFMKLSSGQMQTMIIIRSLLKKPDYLIFDEATSSMDIEKSNKALNAIKTYIEDNGIPTIWCSHNLEEIEFMCNRFSILKNGSLKLLTKYDFKNFKKNSSSYCFEIINKDLEKLVESNEIEIINEFKSSTLVKFKDESLLLSECIKILVNKNIEIIEIINKKNTEYFSYE